MDVLCSSLWGYGEMMALSGRGPTTVGGAVELVAETVSKSKRLLVLCGAGMSTASGIPDYRGPSGAWRMTPQAARGARLDLYMSDEGLRRSVWLSRLTSPMFTARPNEAHYALGTLQEGAVCAFETIFTQNIDGLQTLAGSPPGSVVELHGNVHRSLCLTCGNVGPMSGTLARVRSGEPDPRCLQPKVSESGLGEVCGGILKSTAVGFGEKLNATLLARLEEEVSAADTALVLGSSLSVNPVAGIIAKMLSQAKTVGVVSLGPSKYDASLAFRIEADLAWFLPQLSGALLGERGARGRAEE